MFELVTGVVFLSRLEREDKQVREDCGHSSLSSHASHRGIHLPHFPHTTPLQQGSVEHKLIRIRQVFPGRNMLEERYATALLPLRLSVFHPGDAKNRRRLRGRWECSAARLPIRLLIRLESTSSTNYRTKGQLQLQESVPALQRQLSCE